PPPSTPPPSQRPAPVPSSGFPGWVTWSGRDVLKGLLAGLLIGLLLAPALVLPFDPDLDSDGALLAAQGLLGVTLVAVAIAGASNWKFGRLGEALRRLGARAFSPSGIGWMFAMLFAYYAFAVIFSSLVLEPEQEDIGEQLGIGDETLAVAVLAVVLIVGLAPISEELFFRGFVFGGLRKRFSFWPAVVIAGLIFGSIHAPTGITTVIPLAVLGGGFCWLYEKTGSIWPCVIAHMINNGIAVAAAGELDNSVVLPLLF
ncbi:MAG: CPBP family intramembrane metalloprotease, partial [Actinomycetota bacterium]|nr:CPBP family intramembrane metalloprotease [Actinomycetota bacterium]